MHSALCENIFNCSIFFSLGKESHGWEEVHYVGSFGKDVKGAVRLNDARQFKYYTCNYYISGYNNYREVL